MARSPLWMRFCAHWQSLAVSCSSAGFSSHGWRANLSTSSEKPSGTESSLASSGLAVVLSQVSVRYRLPTERINTLKERVIRRLTGRSVKYNEFWALRQITLRAGQGEAIG